MTNYKSTISTLVLLAATILDESSMSAKSGFHNILHSMLELIISSFQRSHKLNTDNKAFIKLTSGQL